VGISRRDWRDEDLHKHIAAILAVKAPHASQEMIEAFLRLVIYHKITFDIPGDYVALAMRSKRSTMSAAFARTSSFIFPFHRSSIR